jgi:hypothetical protein
MNNNILVVLSYESHRYFNGSVVPNFTNGKYVCMYVCMYVLYCHYYELVPFNVLPPHNFEYLSSWQKLSKYVPLKIR